VGSKAFGGLHRRLKEKTAESRWFETTGQAPFGRAKAAYWKINRGEVSTKKSQDVIAHVESLPQQPRQGYRGV
jgi:hypothetical protein